ncbi:TetR/AcrR family transcriptional regulator [Streptomyces tailanensis]|uniref:TetR/AcrR family transcriptional regulator n=1 Tax=Streptomyces tailanensis TaxID=2569858 RepID=UPI00122E0744|nr:helix-turn-helix domain-containing protein [Streptomyces tailanensis]
MARISAQERRESVVRAAIAEFALKGYYGTSTEAIAKRVSVTQPYLFRLFPGKKAIFVAALVGSMEDTRLAFERATDGMEGSKQARGAMAGAYARLISARPETLLMQMQGYAVVAAAEAEGDDQTGELVRADWMRLWETVHLSLGANAHETTRFFACGMLGNTLTAIGLPSDCRAAGA